MEPIYISISMEATGRNIRALMQREGYSVRDIQSVMGFAYPQAVYNWISGKTLPAIENLLILSRLFHTSVENILVLDEDVAVFARLYGNRDRNSKSGNISFPLLLL